MTFVVRTCFLLVGTLYGSYVSAGDSVQVLEFAVNNRMCPSDTTKYEIIRAADACPKPSCTTFDCSAEWSRCLDKVSRNNAVIAKYNNFMGECERMR